MTTPRPSETRSPATNVPSTTVTPDLDMNSTPTSPAMGVPLSGAPGPADDKNKAQNEAAGGSENDGGMTGMELFAIAGGALCAIVLMMVVVVARRRRNMSASKEGSVNRWTDNGAFLTSRRNALLLQPPTTSQHPRALDTMDMLNMIQTDTRTKSVRFASDILNHPRTLNSMDSNILNDVDDSIQTSETPRLSSAWSIGTSELCISQGEDQPSTWTMTDQPLEDIEEASADDDISSAFSSSMGGSLTFSPSSQGTSWSGSSDISVEHHTARDFMSTASSFDSNDLMDTSRYLDMIHADVHVAEDV
ncbi:hypothetical protein DYB26_001476 [Aphanomyces astaci]|uniref:Uncharacterized protein n=2 Tax=Aphanomyces astaci TaxID=112090 RepID=A0A397ES94_APHAT|nr:hypothetical protein DYB38_001556 [Aphanomyces astaci]RHZ04715.1 hypothetical protein DYB31_000049 [Aphanomyces astaci]RHZ35083.1 hypothetical protein DYB26_001476 [Aphanomyces astaci]